MILCSRSIIWYIHRGILFLPLSWYEYHCNTYTFSGFFILHISDPTFFSAPAGTVSIGSAGLFPTIAAFLHLWFGTFLADRAVRLRCVFTDDRFLIMDRFNAKTGTKLPEGKLTERRKNFAVGGPDGWTYDHFINWDFFPNVHLPVLVYFKEDQTPKSKWNVGPGEYDKRNDGMVHFFPAFGNSFQLKREFELRGLSKTNPQRD